MTKAETVAGVAPVRAVDLAAQTERRGRTQKPSPAGPHGFPFSPSGERGEGAAALDLPTHPPPGALPSLSRRRPGAMQHRVVPASSDRHRRQQHPIPE